MVDQFLVADEFKLRHVVIAQAYGVFYVLFNVIWYYEGWKNKLLYEVLDWDNKPLVACIYSIGSVVILIPLFALVHSFIYRWERSQQKLGSRVFFVDRPHRLPCMYFVSEPRVVLAAASVAAPTWLLLSRHPGPRATALIAAITLWSTMNCLMYASCSR